MITKLLLLQIIATVFGCLMLIIAIGYMNTFHAGIAAGSIFVAMGISIARTIRGE
jgi:hypothetical protein